MPARPRAELERMAEDITQSGASFWVPRRIAWFGHRRAEAEDVARELERPDSRLQVQMPDAAERQPVLSPADLAEVAYFRGKGPAPDEQAVSLNGLSQAGFQLLDGQGRTLGTYGAHNALTEPGCPVQGQLHEVSLPLERAELGKLAAFYQQDPLGQLELQGYQFYDQAGRQRLAWGAEPPARVGREGAWIEVRKPEELGARLHEFEQLLQETGDAATARQLQDLPPDQPLLVKQLLAPLKDRSRLVPGALRRLSGVPGDQLKELGRELANDPVSRRLWLEELSRRPETARGAREALGCCQLSASLAAASWELYQAGGPVVGPVLDRLQQATWLSADLRRNDEAILARLAVEGLGDKPAARAVDRWFAGAPSGQAARVLLERPEASRPEELRQLALRAGGNRDTLERQVQELLPDPAPVKNLMDAMGSYGWNWVAQAALQHPERDTADKAAAFYDAVRAPLDKATWLSSQREPLQAALAEGAMAELGTLPESKATVERVRGWFGGEVPYRAAMAVVASPTGANPRELARTAGGDKAARMRQIDDLVHDPEPVKSLLESIGLPGLDWVSRAALQHPDRRSLGELTAYYQAIQGPFQQATWLGNQRTGMEQALARAIVGDLSRRPESAPTVKIVQDWFGGEIPYRAASALLAHPEASTPEELQALALQTGGDAAVRQRQIDQLVTRPEPVKTLLGTIGSYGTEWVAQAALRHPTRSTPQETAAFYGAIQASVQQATWLGNQRPAMELALAGAALQDLERFPSSRDAVEKLRSWHDGAVPYAAVRSLLAHPSPSTPAELCALARDGGGTPEARVREIRELVAEPEPVVEFLEAPGSYHQHWVATAALNHPDRKSPEEVAAFFREVRHSLDQATWLGQNRAPIEQALATAVRADLGRFPECREALERTRGWFGDTPPYSAACALLEHARARTPDELRALALQAGGDKKARERQIGQLVNRPAPVLDLLEKVGGHGQAWVARAALEHPQRSTPAELVAFYQAIQRQMDAATWLGSQRAPLQEAVSRSFVAELEGLPESRDAVSWLGEQGVSDWGRLSRALMARPTAGTLEERCRLAAQVIAPGDDALQSQLIASMAGQASTRSSAEVASRLLQVAQTPQGRWAVTVAALENPVLDEVSGKTITARVAELLTRYRHASEVTQDARRLADMASVTEEVLRLARGPERSQTIREDADRLLVGGTVLKKRDEEQAT